MALSKGQLAFLACTIYQQLKDGKVTTDKPEGKFVFIKTPIFGPSIDGSTERPQGVPNGAPNDDGSTSQAADYWYQEYSQGELLSGYGWGFGEPKMPEESSILEYPVLQEFIAANDTPNAA